MKHRGQISLLKINATNNFVLAYNPTNRIQIKFKSSDFLYSGLKPSIWEHIPHRGGGEITSV